MTKLDDKFKRTVLFFNKINNNPLEKNHFYKHTLFTTNYQPCSRTNNLITYPGNMDIELLTSTYQQYKSDATSFCTWLSEQAAACGYVMKERFTSPNSKSYKGSSLSLGEKLREKAAMKAQKREAKKAATAAKSGAPTIQKTTTRDILLQAQAVANKDLVTLPVKIFEVVKRALMPESAA